MVAIRFDHVTVVHHGTKLARELKERETRHSCRLSSVERAKVAIVDEVDTGRVDDRESEKTLNFHLQKGPVGVRHARCEKGDGMTHGLVRCKYEPHRLPALTFDISVLHNLIINRSVRNRAELGKFRSTHQTLTIIRLRADTNSDQGSSALIQSELEVLSGRRSGSVPPAHC